MKNYDDQKTKKLEEKFELKNKKNLVALVHEIKKSEKIKDYLNKKLKKNQGIVLGKMTYPGKNDKDASMIYYGLTINPENSGTSLFTFKTSLGVGFSIPEKTLKYPPFLVECEGTPTIHYENKPSPQDLKNSINKIKKQKIINFNKIYFD